MNGEERKTAGATREDIDNVLEALHDYKHYLLKALDKNKSTLEQRVHTLEIYAKVLIGGVGITLAGIVAVAVSFGILTTNVANTAAKTDEVRQVVLSSNDSLVSKTSAIQQKLNDLDKKLDELSTQPRRK